VLEFRKGNAEVLPFADESFDAVVGNFVTLHLGRPERAAAEFARVLGAGGRLALTVWRSKHLARNCFRRKGALSTFALARRPSRKLVQVDDSE
jgi:ubiquinone/menaquinone biosynthesis C-methylase UbiE